MHGIIISEDQILVHMLWVDDLILVSDTAEGLQKQLNGLATFCGRYQMIVNAVKTKVMIIGKNEGERFTFNENEIEICEQYNYLGVIFNQIQRSNGNCFRDMMDNVPKKAMKTIFAVMKKCKSIGKLTPKIAITLFDTYVLPILEYGCEIWSKGELHQSVEAVQLKFLKMMLGVKNNTATVAIYAETGRFPLYLRQKVRIVKYWIRLERLKDNTIVKTVFNMLKKLDNLGYKTWFSNVRNILEACGQEQYILVSPLNIHQENACILAVKEFFYGNFINECISAFTSFPVLRTYKGFKLEFKLEQYLIDIKDFKLRKMISKFRLSSHTLQIEKGRHCKPVIDVHLRTCNNCDLNVIEDEPHMLLVCPYYIDLRIKFFCVLLQEIPSLFHYDRDLREIFNMIMSCNNTKVLFSLGKYLLQAFQRQTDNVCVKT